MNSLNTLALSSSPKYGVSSGAQPLHRYTRKGMVVENDCDSGKFQLTQTSLPEGRVLTNVKISEYQTKSHTRSAGIISGTGVQRWTVPVNLPYLTFKLPNNAEFRGDAPSSILHCPFRLILIVKSQQKLWKRFVGRTIQEHPRLDAKLIQIISLDKKASVEAY